jgi:hypothetical protein
MRSEVMARPSRRRLQSSDGSPRAGVLTSDAQDIGRLLAARRVDAWLLKV